MAMLVELTEEEMVETDGVTSWSASSIGTAGLLPAEVETEGEACSESARLTSS